MCFVEFVNNLDSLRTLLQTLTTFYADHNVLCENEDFTQSLFYSNMKFTFNTPLIEIENYNQIQDECYPWYGAAN